MNRSLQALRRQAGLVLERRTAIIPSWLTLVRLAGFDGTYLAHPVSPLQPSAAEVG